MVSCDLKNHPVMMNECQLDDYGLLIMILIMVRWLQVFEQYFCYYRPNTGVRCNTSWHFNASLIKVICLLALLHVIYFNSTDMCMTCCMYMSCRTYYQKWRKSGQIC